GAETDIRFAIGECSLGSILVAQSQRGVCAILMGDDPNALARDLQDQFPRARFIGGDANFERLVAKVVGLVETPGIGIDLPLVVRDAGSQYVAEVKARVDAVDWASVSASLDARGNAVVGRLASAAECRALASLYPNDNVFRSRVVMAQHGFGRGEYKYFAHPL